MEHRACKGCGTDLTGTHGLRIWCSEACRRRTEYGGTCETCGARTDGSNGIAAAPRHCARCAPAAGVRWTRERIIAAIREWTERHGSPPSSRDWWTATAKTPGHSTVMRRFGGWDAAIRAALDDPQNEEKAAAP